jgi:hypothetical protein
MSAQLDEFGQPIVDTNPPLAEVDMVPTGSQMSQEFLNQPFDPNWDDAKKELWGAKWETGVNMTPSDAAQSALKIRDDQRKREIESREKADDPVRQATLEAQQLKVEEAKRVQSEYAQRRQNALKTIEEVLADEKEYAEVVGPWDGSVGGVIDSLGVNEGRQVKRAKLSRLLFGDILELTKFLRPTTEKDIQLAQQNVPGRFQNWPVFKDYLNEKRSVLLANETALVNPVNNLPIGAKAPSSQEPNVYQQAQQNPAQQLKQSLESGDSVNITQPDGSVLTLKKVTNQDGTISWE